MPKIRIYDLARQAGISNKTLVDEFHKLGIAVKSHSSNVEQEEADRVLASLGKKEPVKASPVKESRETVPPGRPVSPAPVQHQGTVRVVPAAKPQVAKPAGDKYAKPVPKPGEVKLAPRPGEAKVIHRPGEMKPAPRPGEMRPPFKPGGGKPAPRPGEARPVAKPGDIRPAPKPGGGKPAPRPGEGRPAPKPGAMPVHRADIRPAAHKAGGPPTQAPKPSGKPPFRAPKEREAPRQAHMQPRGGKPPVKGLPPKSPVAVVTPVVKVAPPPAPKLPLKLSEAITVKDLAEKLDQKSSLVIKRLMEMGHLVSINQLLDVEVAAEVGKYFGHPVSIVELAEEEVSKETAEAKENLVPRPPVVTIMGHVDHGKTLLLDAIRRTNVVMQEAGGITQHIGAYKVALPGKGEVAFLDTPGHAAFTAMRARGVKVTDIVVLVVAADDGVMPQTVEALNHARAAGVPVLVAVNKIDKPEANPDRVRQELAKYDLMPEEWGGKTIFVNISAKKQIGLNDLLEMLLLESEMLELKANPSISARGVIVEAKLDRGRGAIATVLVQNGTLKVGDAFVCGLYSGRVRAMFDDNGRKVEQAGPSTPVEVLGFEGIPEAGDTFVVVANERKAHQIAELRRLKQREKMLAKTSGRISLEALHQQIKEGTVKELNLIIKADVQGSAEAVREAVLKLSTDKVKINCIHESVGGITETDVALASASNAIILGFNVRPEPKAAKEAEREGVDINLYNIIYQLTDDVKAAIEGMLEPTFVEETLGRAEVREVFRIAKVGNIAGVMVTDGKISRTSQCRIIRDNVVVYDGKLASLKHLKDDVKELAAGYEGGIGIENFQDIKRGDVIESYIRKQSAASPLHA